MNEQSLQKKYGLITAICMVVGTVIGSGIFFKAGKVLANNNGNMTMSLLTVAAVGLIMLICAYVFSILAGRHAKVNGVVDYAEATCGPVYAYAVGWFMSVIYYPIITACLAWVSAQYTCTLFGFDTASDVHLAVAAFYLMLGYAVNTLSPRIAGKVQVSTTVIKLIPLGIMAIVGTIVGLFNGMTVDALTNSISTGEGGMGIFGAITAFAFAYEGWIITTTINAELVDAKKNLPRALIIGSFIVIGVYMAYFLGMTGVLTTDEIMGSENLPQDAFGALFGHPVFGTFVYVFVIISCLGTLNGLVLGCSRGLYSLAARGQGPAPRMLSQIDPVSNMPANSAIISLLLCGVWLLQWELGFIQKLLPPFLAWENDELPIITLYLIYIPIFVVLMCRAKDLSPVQRFLFPALAIAACVFMVYCAVAAYRMEALYYVIVFVLIMAVGMLFYRKDGKAPLSRLTPEKK